MGKALTLYQYFSLRLLHWQISTSAFETILFKILLKLKLTASMGSLHSGWLWRSIWMWVATECRFRRLCWYIPWFKKCKHLGSPKILRRSFLSYWDQSYTLTMYIYTRSASCPYIDSELKFGKHPGTFNQRWPLARDSLSRSADSKHMILPAALRQIRAVRQIGHCTFIPRWSTAVERGDLIRPKGK